MSDKMLKAAPVPTLRRLASYYHYLKQLEGGGRDYVSCTRIAEHMMLDPTQVRKDVEATGLVGKPKVGYPVRALIEAVETFLGWNRLTDAFLVGAGNLGAALMGYTRFNLYGLNIVAAFDIDPAKVGSRLGQREILPLDKLSGLAQRMHIPIGIITVPAEVAQTVANLMVSGGIRCIWNFAPAILELPEDVIVENVSLASSFAVLSNRLAQRTHNAAIQDKQDKETDRAAN
jgi:redox-sensing transcriptional repressor